MSYGFSDPSPLAAIGESEAIPYNHKYSTAIVDGGLDSGEGQAALFILPTMAEAHTDIRWNPELKEWFCAKCGQNSDHVAKEDAIREMATFDCTLQGTTIAKLGEKERLLRAHYLAKQHKRNE